MLYINLHAPSAEYVVPSCLQVAVNCPCPRTFRGSVPHAGVVGLFDV